MCKVIIFILFIFLSEHGVCHAKHLNELKRAFPYGLLTDDYGVLTIEDLKINACVAEAAPFSEKSHSYPYWQCFESKVAHLNCEGKEYDLYEKSRMTLLTVSARINGELHEYLYRRTMPLTECRVFQKEWQRLLKGQDYVCVSGPFISTEKNRDGRAWSWVFDRYKTKNGWDGSYLGSCMPKEKKPN